jgi:hypothetical protein
MARWAALIVCGAVAVSAQDEIFIDILPEDGTSTEHASEIYSRLMDAVSVDGGNRDVDSFDSLSGIASSGISMSAEEANTVGVDIYSETGIKATAGDSLELIAGAGLEAKIQDKAEMTVGALDLQALASLSILSGDDAEVSVDGDIGTVATGAVSLDAGSLTTEVAGAAALTAGGALDVTARGSAKLEASSLLAQVRGDIDATGAALKLSGTKELSVVAEDIDVQTPGAVKIAGKGGVAELGGESTMEYVGYKWSSNANFDSFENVLPETVNDVTEIVVRAGYAGSAAEFIATVPTTITIEVGTADGTGTVTYTKAWSSAVGIGTFSLDGLVVSMATPVDVSTIKLTASNGAGTFSGWTEVLFNLGVETAGGMLVASAGDIEATAAKSVLLNAESVSLSSSTDLDVSASTSARLASKDVSVLASETLAAAALDLSVQVSDTIEAFSGGDATASFGSVDAESRGPASLTAAGAVSVAAEAATVAVSGDLDATADSVKLNTESLETMSQTLTATAAESATLYTTDASLSLSGQLSAFMGEAEVLVDGDLNVQSQGDVTMRNRDLTVESDTTTMLSREMDAVVGNLKLHAQKAEPRHVVSVPCTDCDTGSGSAMRSELAEMLGVPASRLRVRVQPTSSGSGRRRMETAPERSIRDWSNAELVDWLRDVLGLAAVADGALREGIDGAMAAEMLRSDWIELGASGLKAAKIITEVRRQNGQ